MILAQDLRDAVLQAAIQGKLTQQLASDSSVDELLEKIRTQKELLIKEKKIKKEKPLKPISEDEIPFDIPANWKWVRLGDLGVFTRGSGIKRDEVTETGYTCIRYGQLYTTYHNYTEKIVSKVPEEVYNKSQKIKYGDIVMALTGENNFDIALAVAYLGNETVAIGGDMTSFSYHRMNPLYLVNAINSAYGISCKSKLATGNIIVHISNDKLGSIPLPVPPIEEQQRIVERVSELMAKIDEFEKIEKQLSAIKKAFPQDMKDALLQAAMQGKLTQQLPSDSSVDDLLENIRKEKEQLIKEKKIKKEKPLKPISEDEIPFDIPDSWRWERVGNIANCGAGATPSRSHPEYYKEGSIPWLKTGELTNSYIYECEEKINELALKKCSLRLNQKDDILIAMYGATIGKLGIVTFPLTTNQACCGCTPFHGVYHLYLFYFLMFCKPYLVGKAEGGAQPNISREKIRNTIIPLPPIEEQERIVQTLEKMLVACEGL